MQGQRVDRVPIYALYLSGRVLNPVGRMINTQLSHLLLDGVSEAMDAWITDDPRYQEIVREAERSCERVGGYVFPELDRRFFLVPREYIEVADVTRRDDSLMISYRVHTPKGPLDYVCEKQDDVSTVWDRKPLITSTEDVAKLLSVPYTLQKPDVDDYLKYREQVETAGGLMYTWVSVPMVCVSQLFRFEEFLTWCVLEKELIRKLIRVAFERIYQVLEYLLQRGVGPVFHFGGSEQATPPMMSPALYDDFVVAFDRQLFDLVHRYGKYVQVHCHGQIRTVLPKLLDMGVDLLDPMEAPPSGDVTLNEAKRMVDGHITLVGNIQFDDMERRQSAEIDTTVRSAIEEGGPDHFILSTTEAPVTRVSPRMRDNYLQLIESGLKYGRHASPV